MVSSLDEAPQVVFEISGAVSARGVVEGGVRLSEEGGPGRGGLRIVRVNVGYLDVDPPGAEVAAVQLFGQLRLWQDQPVGVSQ